MRIGDRPKAHIWMFLFKMDHLHCILHIVSLINLNIHNTILCANTSVSTLNMELLSAQVLRIQTQEDYFKRINHEPLLKHPKSTIVNQRALKLSFLTQKVNQSPFFSQAKFLSNAWKRQHQERFRKDRFTTKKLDHCKSFIWEYVLQITHVPKCPCPTLARHRQSGNFSWQLFNSLSSGDRPVLS